MTSVHRSLAVRLVAGLAAILCLSNCLYLPSNYMAAVDLRRDGRFSVRYTGEIVVRSPSDLQEGGRSTWNDSMAVCLKDGSNRVESWRRPPSSDAGPVPPAPPTFAQERPCTAAERLSLRQTFKQQEKTAAAKRMEDSSNFARIFGISGGDPASGKALADNLMKYEGWKSVAYKGDGVFQVDYAVSGRLDHDQIFPLFPRSTIVLPFLALQRRTDGAVLVTTPGLSLASLGALQAAAAQRGGLGGSKGSGDRGELLPQDGKGSFTITTDGEILTNNTADGAVADPGGRRLEWHMTGESGNATASPEALIRLK